MLFRSTPSLSLENWRYLEHSSCTKGFFFTNESNSFLVGQVNRVLIALGLTNWSHTGTLHAVIKVKPTLGLIISPVFVETDVA